ncbi:hypothetical protein ACIHEJ_08965 [Streptomyces sp. NPDC052301]|uniref:hypothetical protein n=1 Tax=Streptomyces sp. NPDC052301 TaxID=3365687 RepID=UPI0037D8E116
MPHGARPRLGPQRLVRYDDGARSADPGSPDRQESDTGRRTAVPPAARSYETCVTGGRGARRSGTTAR